MFHYRRIAGLTLACAIGLAVSLPAMAYPNSVVLSPTGDVKGQGQVGGLFLTAFLNGNPFTFNGVNVGLLPTVPYGSSGLSFGGVELGYDIQAFKGLNPDLKPVLNVKAQLLVENGWLPHVAVGAMGVAPHQFDRSVNLLYLATTKTLAWGTVPLGRLSVGVGGALPQAADVFKATFPFPVGTTGVMMAGYESPFIGPFNLAADHMGGLSEMGLSTVALNIQTMPGSYLGIGYALNNDRSAAADTVFVYFAPGFDVIRLVTGSQEGH